MAMTIPLLLPLIVPMAAQAVAFWITAPFIVAGAIGVIVNRKAVHSALALAVVMVGLAVLYAALDAPFLFVAQIVVYTGAILMLILFVIMLVGVDTGDSRVETIRHHWIPALLATLGFGILLVVAVGRGITTGSVGLGQATAGNGNVVSLAERLFTRWVFPFEATAALLITAALGAMVLAHGEKLRRKLGQADILRNRMRDYADKGAHPGPAPSPGVFARTNVVGAPALLPDGSVAESSVSHTLELRSAIVDAGELRAPTKAVYAELDQAAADAEEARS